MGADDERLPSLAASGAEAAGRTGTALPYAGTDRDSGPAGAGEALEKMSPGENRLEFPSDDLYVVMAFALRGTA